MRTADGEVRRGSWICIPALAEVMSLDDPEAFIEEHKDFWFLIGNEIALEPMLSDLGMMIEHVLDQAERLRM
jgi:hypothetical protein